ncbi:MAG: alpha-amylase, partial [Anaerolineaceae bacterium]|nr:alpha-amylase [Anaerolineaceae bacterium]
DVIGLLIKDKELRDNPPNPDAHPDLPENDLHGRQLHIYTEDQDEVHDIIKDIRRTLDSFSGPRSADDRCGIGELWGPMERWVRYYGENNDELHLPFNFRLMWQPWSAKAMRASVDEMEAALPPFAWPNYVLGNHDQGRLATRFGGLDQARLAGMMLLTLRGTPTVYYGDELGFENGIIPPEKIQDPQGINLGAERTRDVARTPMQWNAGPQAGFSTAEPWLPVSADYTTRNVSVQAQNPHSMLSFFKQLFWLRRGSPALYGGSYTALDVEGDCFVYLREQGSENKLIVLNFSGNHSTISAGLDGKGSMLLSTHMDRDGEISLNCIKLRPYEGVVIDY